MAKDLNTAVEGFRDAGISRSDNYRKGTAGKGGAWNSAKSRAKSNFAPAMQEVLSKKTYESGLDRANASDYDAGVQNKGIANWGVGMQASGDKYAKGVQPFVPLWSQSLTTSRGPKRSANNIKRMTENVQRFIDAKK